jgi:hypothetical protein
MMPLAYLADMIGADELSQADPFGGNGQKISVGAGLPREEAISLVEAAHPGCSYVLWGDCAWIAPPGEAGDSG